MSLFFVAHIDIYQLYPLLLYYKRASSDRGLNFCSLDNIMKIFLFFIIFLIPDFNEAVVRDLSGTYDFQDCSCTVLRCLESSFYQITQTQNGDFTIYYTSNIIAGLGQTTSINDGQQTQVSIRWLPGMDFDTTCTGLWVPTKRSIDLKCGDQYRYCTGQLKCRQNSGSCAKNGSTSLNSQYIETIWKTIISLLFLSLFLIETRH